MKVLICTDTNAAIDRAAHLMTDRLRDKPKSVFGLATGSTMEPLYDRWIAIAGDEGLSFARARTFNLDEYVGLPASHPQSYHHYMERFFFDRIDIDRANAHLPNGAAPDPAAEAKAYEGRIANAGGIDLQLIGIGRNGHIGFNEPTSSLTSRTRLKTLTRSTLEANAAHFPPGETPPRYVITMGIGTILESRACLLLATGAGKAEAVERMIEGAVSAACPASALQFHPSATIVLDPEAASCLKLRDYYEQVHPAGRETTVEGARGA
ncbi:glucosamine-6-phosphate deaminase [Notoacmeibacter ruber]|uniref:Glucosamine-6-phosphate deaminase n=1 Tax=Notoacmeibacter ruber TaxID=2670375 RepID=A0A3L7J4B5_9HYPH|nr:glucosamine-6-phosphate deaminase [Notoacmeibacter ruber]RLQ85299.1 glucosamine-6-phosphate deaminase [Notoacmeibacter ruber]